MRRSRPKAHRLAGQLLDQTVVSDDDVLKVLRLWHFSHNMRASGILGEAVPITTDEAWRELRGEHCVGTDVLPYKKTFGLPILKMEKLVRPVRYKHPRGAVGIVKQRG